MQPDAISYIVPAYKCEGFLDEMIGSIVEGNIEEGEEIIIVNDKSTDNTLDIIRRWVSRHSFVHGFDHEVSRGGGAARNTAVRQVNNRSVFC